MTPTVLHVLPLDVERGAQRFARDLRDTLDGAAQRHLIATLFEPAGNVLDADIALSMSRRRARMVGYDPRVTARLRGVLHDVQPDVIVAHGSEPLKYSAAARRETPLVYYRIGVSHLARRQGLRRSWHARLVRRADFVVGVSSACIDEVVHDYGVSEERTTIIPNGRRPQDYPPRTYPAEPDQIRLAFVGHLTETKRPGVFLDIVDALKSGGCAVSGTVAGGGPLLPMIRDRATSLGLAVTGPTSRVAEILRGSDVFVFTSVPTGEGMPGVMIEAGLVGLPSIVTDVPGARDVIVDGVTGFVVPPHQPMDAVALIASLGDDPGRRREMGLAARERCSTHFTLDASSQAWEQLLEPLLR